MWGRGSWPALHTRVFGSVAHGGQATPGGAGAPRPPGAALGGLQDSSQRVDLPQALPASSQCLLRETWIPRALWIISFNWVSREAGDSCHGAVSG